MKFSDEIVAENFNVIFFKSRSRIIVDEEKTTGDAEAMDIQDLSMRKAMRLQT